MQKKVLLPEALHRVAKSLASTYGLTLAAFVIEAVEKHILVYEQAAKQAEKPHETREASGGDRPALGL